MNINHNARTTAEPTMRKKVLRSGLEGARTLLFARGRADSSGLAPPDRSRIGRAENRSVACASMTAGEGVYGFDGKVYG